MYNSLSHKTKQFFWLILKIAIVIACGYFLYFRIFKNSDFTFSTFKEVIFKNDVISFKNMVILVCFSFLNWLFEVLKWQNLVSFCTQTSVREAMIQSLASLTTSLITPNRIGEYPAKALYYSKTKQKQILGLNFLHNSFQLGTTFFFGVIGVAFLIFSNKIIFNIKDFYIVLMVLVIILITLRITLKKIRFLKNKLKKAYNFWRQISVMVKQKTILFSVFRYLIFSHQFYYLLLIFNFDITYTNAISGIFTLYLIASILPVLSLFDVVLKGAVAVFVFSFFNIPEIKILSISLLMWIFNFVFPALFGSYFVLTFKPKLAI